MILLVPGVHTIVYYWQWLMVTRVCVVSSTTDLVLVYKVTPQLSLPMVVPDMAAACGI